MIIKMKTKRSLKVVIIVRNLHPRVKALYGENCGVRALSQNAGNICKLGLLKMAATIFLKLYIQTGNCLKNSSFLVLTGCKVPVTLFWGSQKPENNFFSKIFSKLFEKFFGNRKSLSKLLYIILAEIGSF